MKTASKTHPLYLKASRGEYIAPKDLATLIRDALKRNFPGCKFAVKTSVYSGGASVTARWQDGPTTKAVDAIIDTYQTERFDGMIDMAHSNNLWIYPDGSAHIAHGEGTEGSRGTAPEVIESARQPDAVLLDNVASIYVFAERTVTARAFRRAIAEYRAQNWTGTESVKWDEIEIVTSDYDGSAYIKSVPTIQPGNGHRYLSDEICSLARSYDLTEPEAEPTPVVTAPVTPIHTPCLCW